MGWITDKTWLDPNHRREISVCYSSYIVSSALLAHYLISTVGSFLWGKVVGTETDRSPLSTGKVKRSGVYLHSQICLNGMERDSFSFM